MTDLDLYYRLAAQGSRQVDGHPGLEALRHLARQSAIVLDLGCGEGTRLNSLLRPTQKGTGIDVNSYAIKLAHAQYPNHHFLSYNGKKLPFKAATFDLIYSAFVLEHLSDPQLFLREAVRVLKPQGHLSLLAPNFGAPNRRSPNSTQPPLQKLLTGFKTDFSPPSSTTLHWTKVTPKKTYTQSDDDTTLEPYLLTLERYLLHLGLTVKASSSLWSLEAKTSNPRKLLFKFLGQLNFFRFRYWGPQIFIVAQKR